MAARTTRTHVVLGALAVLALTAAVATTGSSTPAPDANGRLSAAVQPPTSSPTSPTTASTTSPTTPPATAPRSVEAVTATPAAAPSARIPPSRPTPRPPTSPPAAVAWTLTKVVDGDTIWASRNGVTLKIRLIGIDTPEAGECGFTEASGALRSIIGGQRVTLTAGAHDDVDRYGRSLRYVDVDGVDAGLRLVQQGYAVARYDSRDGYGRHPRETAYVRADALSPRAGCVTPRGTTPAAPTPTPARPSPRPPVIPPARPSSGWPLAGDQHPCPQSRPVKGNEPSMIAHSPGQQSYLVTNPEQCFGSLSQAASAGFRPARR